MPEPARQHTIVGRQAMRALAEVRARQLGHRLIFFAAALTAALIYVPPAWIAGCAAALVASELLERRAARQLLDARLEAFARAWRDFVLANIVVASAGVLIAAVFWIFASPQDHEHIFPLAFIFISTFYVALVNQQVLWLLMVRQALYCGLAAVLALRDMALLGAPTATSLVTQLLPVLALVGYVLMLSIWSARAYRKHLEHVHALAEARDEADQARQAKATLIATISHELRTPLNGVIGMAQALLSAELDPAVRRQIEVIAESGRNLNGLLNDILDFSRLRAGRLPIVPTENDLRKTIDHIEGLFRPVAEERGLDFVIGVGEEVPERLVFDAVRVRQCLSNLVSNALKFTERGSVALAVSAGPADRAPDGTARWRVVATVSDTGIGIPEAQQNHLFAPFSQADGSIGRRFGGTGLGLSITRHLAEAMGGGVTLESVPDEGSIFRLSFIAEAAREGADDTGASARGERPRTNRVLVADGAETNRMVMRVFLRQLGLETVEAESGQAAMAELDRGDFDAALIDLALPGLDGAELAAHIRRGRAGRPDLPLVAISDDAERAGAAQDGDFDGFVAKPIDPIALRATMQAILPERVATPPTGSTGKGSQAG